MRSRESPAVQLFVQRALAADPDLRLDPDDHRTVAAICRALDGLPLAIELAASRCHLLTLAQIHEQLSRPLSIGERALRDLPDRQQTLHATIAWSYELLTASAQAVLRGAGVFLGGFTPGSARGGGRAAAGSRAVGAAGGEPRAPPGGHRPLRAARARARIRARGRAARPGKRAGPRPSPAVLRRAGRSGQRGVRRRCRGGRAVGPAAGRSRQPARGLRRRRPGGRSGVGHRAGARLAAPVDRGQPPAGERRADRAAARSLFRFPASTSWRCCESWPRSSTRREHGSDGSPTARPSWATRKRSGWPPRSCSPRRSTRATARRSAACARCCSSLIAPGTSPRVLGWVHYSLWGDAYLDGRFESALRARVARAWSWRRRSDTSTCWSARWRRGCSPGRRSSGEITQPELAEVVELARRHGVHSVAVAALWFVARYAAGVDPESAGRWLALAERIRTELDTARSLEEVLREETMAVLRITDLGPLLAAVPPFDPATALDEAAAWVASRSPSETAPREPVAPVVSPAG